MELFSIIYFLMIASLATNLFILTLSINYNSGHNSPWCDALVTLCDIHGVSTITDKQFKVRTSILHNFSYTVEWRRSSCWKAAHNDNCANWNQVAMNNSTVMKNSIGREDVDYIKESGWWIKTWQSQQWSQFQWSWWRLRHQGGWCSFGQLRQGWHGKSLSNHWSWQPSQSSTSTPGTGLVARVLLVDFCLKVPQNEVDLIHSRDENGGVLVDVECRFKKTEEDDMITHSK